VLAAEAGSAQSIPGTDSVTENPWRSTPPVQAAAPSQPNSLQIPPALSSDAPNPSSPAAAVSAPGAPKLSEAQDQFVRQLARYLADVELQQRQAGIVRASDIRQSGEAMQPESGDRSPAAAPGAADATPRFDPSVVAAGTAAFQTSCTQCHDAERSTGKRKSLSAWRATVRRMAAKEGAEVPPGDVEPIAVYLASLNPDASSASGSGDSGGGLLPEGMSVFSTVSLNHRSGLKDGMLENAGFFPEVWLGFEWQSSGPLSARVHACVSCHSENLQGSRVELAEGFMRLDVDKLILCGDDAPLQAHIDAGRFIVPFGAFAAASHPGAYRTATRPLMYNMGQNIYQIAIAGAGAIGPPILPMPYSDEGVLLSASRSLIGDVNATFDGYAVNGLQGTSSMNLSAFWASRDYVDNNADTTVGGRVTVGNSKLRMGASIMSGRYNSDRTGVFPPPTTILDYKIYGYDVTARYEDVLRVHAEYARRISDAFPAVVVPEDIAGWLLEGEVRLWKKPRVSAVVRYDDQRHLAGPAIAGLSADGTYGVYRFTYGLNIAVGSSSTLMINHERWNVPNPLPDADILAIRWVATF
jgi:hypothetical protein